MLARRTLAFYIVAALWALAAIAAGVGLMFGNPVESKPLMLAQVAPLVAPLAPAWLRKWEPMKVFMNVAATGTAFSEIPRYGRTILGMLLQLGGTTFTKAMIARIELKLGSKTIWGPVTGTQLQRINEYTLGKRDRAGTVLVLDFTLPNVKEIGAEQLGGLDLHMLPPGILVLEVETAGATAPTLRGDIVWGAQQGESDLAGLMCKLVRKEYPQFPAGEASPVVSVNGAMVARQFIFYGGATAATVAAQTGEGVANAGDGVFGAVAVAAGTRCGRYKARCIETAANVGRFLLTDPDGTPIGTFNVATAFDIGGLSGTLADGATDFAAGDGFFIDVGAGNGNLTRVQVRRSDDVQWDMSDFIARFQQERYGRMTQDRLYVLDFAMDNHGDSFLKTGPDASKAVLDYVLTFTAADSPIFVHQLMAPPL